jgi:hypothetical protein
MSRKGRQRRSRKHAPAAPEAPPASASRPTSRPPAVAWLTSSEAETKSVSISSRPPGVDHALEPETWHHRIDDEASYPAVDVDTRFFESGRPALESAHHGFDDRDPRQSLRLTPTVVRRRAQFIKYVKGAVGLSLALCVAALVKGAVARSRPAGDASRAPAIVLAGSPAAADQVTGSPEQQGSASSAERVVKREDLPSNAPDVPVAAESALAPPEQAPALHEPAKAANPAGAASVARETPAAQEAVTPPPAVAGTQVAKAPQAVAVAQVVTASRPVNAPTVVSVPPARAPQPAAAPQAVTEKSASQAALERGKIAASIAAGERSVALDPTDGEAWLVLGAAYQAQGNASEARRCYSACVQKGNRGPRRECAAMLR